MRLEAFLSLVSNINKSSIVLIYLNILFIGNVHIHGRTEGGGEVQGVSYTSGEVLPPLQHIVPGRSESAAKQ